MTSNYWGAGGHSSKYSAGGSYCSGIWQGSDAFSYNPPSSDGTAPHRTETQQNSGASQMVTKKPAFKLRKALHPKAPLTILNELAGVGAGKAQFEYLDVPEEERRRRAWQADMDFEEVGSFECRCTALSLEFIAEGTTKSEAKSAVVEIAIQGLISVQCQKNEEEGVGPNEDNCPWSLLASLALYKLYNSWQSQGYSLPPELTSLPGEVGWVVGGGGEQGGCGGVQTNIEKAVIDKPPLQLVNEMASRMRCTLDFELTSEVGTPNDKVFTMAMKVGGKEYCGQGKNKKSAKQAAASAALQDQANWYTPPSQASISPGIEEEQEQPPVKRRTLLDQAEMVTLLRGDGRPSAEDTLEEDTATIGQDETATIGQDEKVLAGPMDKGLQPGSHPSNVK